MGCLGVQSCIVLQRIPIHVCPRAWQGSLIEIIFDLLLTTIWGIGLQLIVEVLI